MSVFQAKLSSFVDNLRKQTGEASRPCAGLTFINNLRKNLRLSGFDQAHGVLSTIAHQQSSFDIVINDFTTYESNVQRERQAFKPIMLLKIGIPLASPDLARLYDTLQAKFQVALRARTFSKQKYGRICWEARKDIKPRIMVAACKTREQRDDIHEDLCVAYESHPIGTITAVGFRTTESYSGRY